MFGCVLYIASAIATVTALYAPSDDVIELNPTNFDHRVIQSDDIWLVEFYAPWCGHCQSLAPEWKKVATALKGVVKIGAVNADEHKGLGGQYGVRGFPTIKVFGQNKKSPSDYQGARSAQGIVDYAMRELKSLINARLGGRKTGGGGGGKTGDPKDVIELTDSNFEELVLDSEDMWLVEFFAPWCGHCKNLAPHWAQAASELKGKVKLGALDATVHTVMSSQYEVQGFPTIKMFPGGKKDDKPVDYDGGRTSSDIVAWALDKVAANIPPPEIYQVTEDKVLNDNCDGHQLCIVSILPHILDCQSKCRNEYISILKTMGESFKKNMWGWIWAEAGAQPNLEESLGIGGFGYPALAAVNSKKMKFSLLKGPFSEKGIKEFLRDLSYGKGSIVPLKNAKLPTIVKTDPWDGRDGELPQEEEIDLSDVEMEDLEPPKKDEL